MTPKDGNLLIIISLRTVIKFDITVNKFLYVSELPLVLISTKRKKYYFEKEISCQLIIMI